MRANPSHSLFIANGSGQSGSLVAEAITGIVIGVIIVISLPVIIIVIVVFVVRKKHEENYHQKLRPPTSQSDSQSNPIPCTQNAAYNETTADNWMVEMDDASYESIPGGDQEQRNIPQQPNSHSQTVEGEIPTIPGPSDHSSSQLATQPENENATEDPDSSSNKDSNNGTAGFDVDQN